MTKTETEPITLYEVIHETREVEQWEQRPWHRQKTTIKADADDARRMAKYGARDEALALKRERVRTVDDMQLEVKNVELDAERHVVTWQENCEMEYTDDEKRVQTTGTTYYYESRWRVEEHRITPDNPLLWAVFQEGAHVGQAQMKHFGELWDVSDK